MATYSYSLSTDFSNGIDPTCLHNTINDFDFPNPFDGLLIEGDNVDVFFTGSLSGADIDELDTIIANHDPNTCTDLPDIGYSIGVSGNAESVGISSTNSSSPQRKLRLNISEVPTGRYRIGWYYEFYHSSQSYDFRSRVQLNDSINLMEHSQEMSDSGDDQNNLASGFSYQNLTEGNHFIDLDYWAENGTSYIKNAKLEIWRAV